MPGAESATKKPTHNGPLVRQKKDKRTKANDKDMSKLSPSLKALINAPFARPGQAPAPRQIRDIYARIAREARERRYGERPWIALSAAATFTLNSPASLLILHDVATTNPPPDTTPLSPLAAAELIREIGLKCISFNGIPRTINCLGAFKAGLSPSITSQLSTTPTRTVTPSNAVAVAARGRNLWHSVYTPFDAKLETKLADSHPDLPVHILSSHYGPLLSDPEPGRALGRVGRALTSVVAIACLRAQTGVGPQVLSHVFGLRKAVEQGVHGLGEEFGGGGDGRY
ncbi:uncharacterized protein CTHT_0017700 [Thermochaetoides thermophila DSM 1495]|uniref:Dol-P-Man:Man(5)GlcNAc(2)-PP-Dol alpha-1,3-mannosyltransferase n=1 Tax=Chaetomium thermophilum (strain DSM 1495 / CBS 144.50 / IMI 039719) TaxID=759272 RepID=G0S2L8_CHATD|nr:hypothetical protein CTHT_0017700 [Thermochaetoides thermophila DSM 1495]EGS22251.1 hypothetical protein CTHT_0017700 [Thermochaetoides thermophila DSM 1495]